MIRQIGEVHHGEPAFEGGCVVHAPSSVPVGETGAVQVFFSPVRQLLLTGKVARILENGACVFRFINLTAEQRRALRVEIAGCAAGSSAMSGHTSSAGPAGLRSHLLPTGAAMPAQVKTFHINAW